MTDEFSRYFTLSEAEHTLREVEPLLVEAMESRRKAADLERGLMELASRIMMSGGLLVSVVETARLRGERDHVVGQVQSALEQIQSTGCVVKDLELGLLDFPARLDNRDVFLCWRLGEDRIRFYHGLEDGFAGRKPLDPRDPGPIQ